MALEAIGLRELREKQKRFASSFALRQSRGISK
jgi:hypothetical protein